MAPPSEVELPTAAARADALLKRSELKIFAQDAHGAQTREHLLNYSVLADVPASLREDLLATATTDIFADRAAGALLGTAVGDSIGAVLEFQDVVDYGDSEQLPSWQCAGESCPAVALEGSPCWVPASSASCPYCGSGRPSGGDAPAVGSATAPWGYSFRTGEYTGRMTNQFRLKPGQWTDDTSMALCMADSLLCCRGFDGSDLRQRFYAWCFGAYNTPFGADERRTFQEGMAEHPKKLEDMWFFDRGSVGCGTNMSRNLERLAETNVGRRPPPTFEAPTEDAGNAPLIRLAPLPVFLHARPRSELLAAARASSYATHPGPVAAECAACLAFLIRAALLRQPSEVPGGSEGGGESSTRGTSATLRGFLDEAAGAYAQLLDDEEEAVASHGDDARGSGASSACEARAALLRLLRSSPDEPAPGSPEWQSPELAWRWRATRTWWRQTLKNRGERYNGYPVSSGYVGSFAMDGLAMALWAAYNTGSFDEALERCVNLQGDADSTGAICGALCGAFYGARAIGEREAVAVQRWDGGGDVALRGILLWYLGGATGGGPPVPPQPA